MNDTLDPSLPCCGVRGLSHRYQTHLAVDNVSFEIAQQSIHGFVGPNGAGKTTTLKVLATLLRPQSGEVQIFGKDVVDEFKAIRNRIGYMQDHFSMYRQMTVHEYLDFFAAAYGLPTMTRRRTIDDILELTDMTNRRDHLIAGLSRGMQQRVSLARALVHDPDFLLLDEPASGLDPRARIELMDILKELRSLGKTIFISSHILTELATLCDNVTILDRGVVKYTGSIAGLVKERKSDEEAVYVLDLDGPNEGVEQALKALSGMHSVETLLEKSLRLRFDGKALSENAVLTAVLGTGAVIKGFREDTKLLSQAFMDLTEPGVRS